MAPVASHLIYLTMGSMADYLFGDGSPQRAQDLLQRLFRAPTNLFSHQYAIVATLSGEVAGLLLAHSYRFANSLELPTAYQLIRAAGILGFIRFFLRLRPLMGIREAEDDEYFVAHLAVVPAHRGKGLGSRLLVHAEQMARNDGFNKVSLTVEVDNVRARDLYLRAGFKLIETVSIEALHRRIGYGGFHRMRKLLD